MSEKIILTVEQDEAIKDLKHFSRKNLFEVHAKNNKWVCSKYACLNEISIDQMARILYEPGSFEVEKPRFKLDDKVVSTFDRTKEVGSVVGVSECGKGLTVSFRTHMGATASANFRHATIEELFWADLKREVNQFVDGDIVMDSTDDIFIVKDKPTSELSSDEISIRDAKKWYENKDFQGFYPSNSFVPYPKP